MPANDFEDPIAVLRETRQRFIAGFHDWATQLDALLGDSAADARGTAAHLLHRMAGLAGTLGFDRVGREASRIEVVLKKHADDAPGDAGDLRRAFADDLAAAAPAASAASAHAQLTVLLVEDDPEQRRVTAAHLRTAGHHVVEVDRGDRAVEAAREAHPNIVLLDLQLPGISGLAVCRLLKHDTALAAIPVVFLTAERDLDDRMAGLALGADDFLIKPIDPRELLLRLDRLAARRPSAEPEPDPVGHLDFEAFRNAAAQALQRESAAIALVRIPAAARETVLHVLRAETRRRDVVGDFDRHHLAVLMPDAAAVAARNRLAAIVEQLRAQGIAGVVAGVAATAAPGARTVDALFDEADAALAAARYRGVAAAIADEERAAIPPAAGGPLVLVGDDDPDVVRIVDAHLSAAGYERVLAFDGAKTLEQLQVHRPAALVLDLMMPRLSGFDVLRRIAEVVDSPPKIIVLSARGREDDVTRAFDLGADDFMGKPFNPQELVARVTRLLR